MPKPLNPPLYLDRLGGGLCHNQIAGQIANRINIGLFRNNQQLPTVRELAAQLEVDHKTVAKAYALLAKLNLVIPEGKGGTRVLRPEGEHFDSYRDLALTDVLLNLIYTVEGYGFTIDEFCDIAPKLLQRELGNHVQPNQTAPSLPPPRAGSSPLDAAPPSQIET